MIAWLRSLFSSSSPKPRELIKVSYLDADRLIREDPRWRIAPEEDHNANRAWVYLERDAETVTGDA
ncbi:MAG TPA: hypothetical protein VFB54_12010 [Burkholderiales bacterium]|nr:hypothetical protein [Burkholderiales bacterium]